MTRDDKIAWMATWAAKNGCALELEGECGFGRECVGITKNGSYPDYADWLADDDGPPKGMPTPPNAYHKHPCVAVLGRGESAEAQLYEWLMWFDANGYTVRSTMDTSVGLDPIKLIFGKQFKVRMAKKEAA